MSLKSHFKAYLKIEKDRHEMTVSDLVMFIMTYFVVRLSCMYFLSLSRPPLVHAIKFFEELNISFIRGILNVYVSELRLIFLKCYFSYAQLYLHIRL